MSNGDNAPSKEDLDWFLQDLVRIANETEESFLSVTLNLSGMIVTGHLIGGKQYFRGLAEEMAGAVQEEKFKGTVREFVLGYSKVYEKTDNAPKKEEESKRPPAFIHLKDAKYVAPGGAPIPNNRGVWWRGRISEIDGFNIGILSQPD